MRANKLKAKIESGGAACGFMVMYDWPEMIQIGAHLGFDYVMMDGEHGYLGVPEIARLVRAAESVDITPVARVSRNAPDIILGFLDAGVQVIVIPSVDTADEARQAVEAVKYHPLGRRGAGYGHPMDWMIKQPFSEYVTIANRETMVLPNCETVEGVANLAEILAVPGIDGVMMGPNDLAQSVGHPGKLDHPAVREAIAQAKQTTLAAGKILAVPAMDGDAARSAIAEGARMTIIGGHRLFVAAGKDYLAKARAKG